MLELMKKDKKGYGFKMLYFFSLCEKKETFGINNILHFKGERVNFDLIKKETGLNEYQIRQGKDFLIKNNIIKDHRSLSVNGRYVGYCIEILK